MTRAKILDCEICGNVIRFFLGKEELSSWYGDDWDDVPYEHNAGRVYDEFIDSFVDVAFSLEHVVSEPCMGEWNSSWSKDDMRKGYVPMIAVLGVSSRDSWAYDHFSAVIGDAKCKRVYMGDIVDIDAVETWLGLDAYVVGRGTWQK